MRLDAAQRRALLTHPAGWIACGFGSGLSPIAPGTVGSAAALLPWLCLRELAWPWYALALVVAFAIGVWASNIAIPRLRIADPGSIVWDEFVGQWIALLPALLAPWWVVLAGFALFRLFDVWKPWPIGWFDRRVKGGFGVMLDDAIAGLFAATVLFVVLRLAT